MESEIVYEVPSSVFQYLKNSRNDNVLVFSASPEEDPEWELYLVPFVVGYGFDGAATRPLTLSSITALDRKNETLMDLPPSEISKLDKQYFDFRMDRILEIFEKGNYVQKVSISNKNFPKLRNLSAFINKEMARLLKELYVKTAETGKVYSVPYLEITKKEEEQKSEKKPKKKEEIVITKENKIEISPVENSKK